MQVVDFSQQSDQGGVEVDLEETVFILSQQGQLQFLDAGHFDFLFPGEDLTLFIFVYGLGNRKVELNDVLVFFTFIDRRAQVRQVLQRLVHSLLETCAPGQGARNGGHICVDGGLGKVIGVEKELSLKEDGLNMLQILLVHLQKHDVFLLQFVLDDRTVEEAFEAV